MLVLIGLVLWIPSFLGQHHILLILSTLLLTIVSATLLMNIFTQTNTTSLPSYFVGSTYWIVSSSVSFLHHYWQTQIIIIAVLLVYKIIQKVNFQEVPVEQAFLSTLILCCTALLCPEILALIVVSWIYLIFRQVMSIRVWISSLIALSMCTMFYAIARFLGWEGVQFQTWDWLTNSHIYIGLGVLIITGIITALPIKKPSIATGIIYLTTMIIAIAWGITSWIIVA